jgi:Flp pilus assembly protein TadB
MLKFIPGILLLQVITTALVLIAPADLKGWGWLGFVIPALAAGFLTAVWFGSIAARQRGHEISRLKEHHAKERENIRVNAERAKTKLVKQVQLKTLRETRRSSARSNIKIWMAFAGAAGLGGLLILTQFMSLGLLIISTAGGALGGYLLRIRQEKGKLQIPQKGQNALRIINATPNSSQQRPDDDRCK